MIQQKPYKVYQPTLDEYTTYISGLMSGFEDWRDRKLLEWHKHAITLLK